MKKIISLTLFIATAISCLHAADDKVYTSVQDLTCINKLISTNNPYHRLDVEKYQRMTAGEQKQAKMCTGLAYAFNTNSSTIGVRVNFINHHDWDNSSVSYLRGFDIYIKKNGEWYWAGTKVPKREINKELELTISSGLDNEEKECILYLPGTSEIKSLELVTEKGKTISAGAQPFKKRIAVFGSSFTHGAGCSRCAMQYPAQLSRITGYNFINMGFSGNCMLQQYFATALIEAQNIDAYVFDGFSNPSKEIILERLFPFIDRFQKEKPGIPLIFMKTIYREHRMFEPKYEARERERMHVVDSLMKIATKKYKDVYWVNSTNATGKYHQTSTDGTHPTDYGYTLWAESVKDPILKIFKKRGI